MDRPGSEIEQTVEDLQKKLGVDPFVIHYPIIKKDQFVGVVDLIDLEVAFPFVFTTLFVRK